MPASLPETPKTHTVRFLFSLWKISPLQTSLLIVMQSLFALLTAAVAPLFVAKLLSHISDGSATFENSQSILIAYLVILFIGDVVAVRAAIFLSFRVVTKMQATVYRRVLSNLMEKDITFHSNRMSGGVVSDATKLHGAIERFWDTIAYSAVPVVVTIVSVCLALVFILWQYAAVLLLLSIITIYFIIKAQNRIAPYSKESSKRGSAVVAYFADVISNIATVKPFAFRAGNDWS
jgi:ATP-binding cassette subfamily B protein